MKQLGSFGRRKYKVNALERSAFRLQLHREDMAFDEAWYLAYSIFTIKSFGAVPAVERIYDRSSRWRRLRAKIRRRYGR